MNTNLKNNRGKPKIVIDTNVWLSGVIFGGQPAQLLRLFIEDDIDVVISEELITELRRKIIQKFPLYTSRLDLLESSLRLDAELVKLGAETVRVSRDPDDNIVIETALLANCHYIVRGDKDLLIIGQYRGVQIMKPAEFLDLFNRNLRIR